MTKIHPTAIVEKGVQLDDDVVIGPHCVVDGQVSIGAGTVLDPKVVISGRVTIGRGNRFYPNSVIGCCPQVLGFDQDTKIGELVIGDRNVVREYVTIHPSRYHNASTQIGNENLMMIGTHIGHDCVVADKVVLSNYVQIGGHCKIDTGVWISGMAASHQFVTLGAWCFVAGLSGLARDIPPFLIVSGQHPPRIRGVNKRGLKRAGLNDEQQEHIYEAYKRLYRQGGTLLANAQLLAQQDDLDDNVRAMVEAIFNSCQHRFGRYRETLRRT
jgi:UDP-N-acetylglucosamine acyltransferase